MILAWLDFIAEKRSTLIMAANNNAKRKSEMPHAYIASKIVMVVVL